MEEVAARIRRDSISPRTVFWVAMASIWLSGRWRPLLRQLADPLGLCVGLILGILLYRASLGLTLGRWPSGADYRSALQRACSGKLPTARRVVELTGRAVYEEAFWRGTLQVGLTKLLGAPLGVAGGAILFAARHLDLARVCKWPMGRARTLELALFSLLLGACYASTGRLMLVVGIHLARNLLLELGCRTDEYPEGDGLSS